MRRRVPLCATLLWIACATNAPAAQLDPKGWKTTSLASEDNINGMLTDNKLETLCTLKREELGGTPPGLRIDLGQTCVLHRVFLAGRRIRLRFWAKQHENRENPPLGLVVVYVGDRADTKNQVAEYAVPYDAGSPVDDPFDMRFRPVAGRYVRIELQTDVQWGKKHWPGHGLSKPAPPPDKDLAWNVAEFELYGFTGANAQTKADAVVLPMGTGGPLALAASDLEYYLGELTGKPHPVIAPEEAGQYPGTLYRIMDLKPLAPTYEEMRKNQQAGKLPGGVNVETNGREVLFKAWPYRCVLWSVWEFLERQGVRWLYPDAHGDFVPASKGVNLSILPLRFTPAAKSIYANWNATAFLTWPPWMRQARRQGFLYVWRNRWNASWNGYGVLGGQEIPRQKIASAQIKEEYKEGFDGYPHNFNSVLPDRILKVHPDWYGYAKRSGKRESGPAFCMSNPELIAWVAAKMTAVEKARPPASRRPLALCHRDWSYNLLPQDATSYCECEKCLALNGPSRPAAVAWVAPRGRYMSGVYYHFVCEVAKAVKPDILVGGLAYAEVFLPPNNIAKFPDNVCVEVCMYGSPNLPIDAPPNAALKQAWEGWHMKCKHLATYDYALLQEAGKAIKLPVPLVTAIVDRAKFLHKLGALNGGCQASPEGLPYNPWNFYAYPRIRWNVEQTADALLREFFAGYYREAGEPMLAYYRTLEDHLIANHIDLHAGGYRYGLNPGVFPFHIVRAMSGHLKEAEAAARSWVVKQRVAVMRDAFTWIESSTGLGKKIGNPDRIPAVGPGKPPLTIVVRDADVVSCPYGRPADFAMQNRYRVGQFVRFEADGEYVVSFSGNGFTAENHRKNRSIAAYVNHAHSAPVKIPDGKGSYRVAVKAKKGIWEVGIQSMQFGEGPFYVRQFTIEPKE